MYHLSKSQSTNKFSSDGRATFRRSGCFKSFRKCWSRPLWTFYSKTCRRSEKRWCCLFACLTVRVMRIKIVPKLDTDSCLNAIMRFTARRGKPVKMISDKGTNFVGSSQKVRRGIEPIKD